MAVENRIHRSVDKANRKARELHAQVDGLKWIIFSDHHRGVRDGADDFVKCESTYVSALSYYFEQGYNLMLLGDTEEFWENPFYKVLKRYDNIFELEKRFHDQDRLIKVWGNHDDLWRYPSALTKHLQPIFKGIIVEESIKIHVHDGKETLGNILFIHGHQGTLDSERFSVISKFFVRYGWRHFQRIFKVPLSTPAKSLKLKSQHDHAMFSWASGKSKQILVCGHTHQPVFMSQTHLDRLNLQIERLEKALELRDLSQTETEDIEQRLKDKKALSDKIKFGTTTISVDGTKKKACYFNSGCCSFSDGDITGLEIVNGEFRLVKWSSKPSEDNPKILDRDDIRHIFSKL